MKNNIFNNIHSSNGPNLLNIICEISENNSILY